MVCIILIICPRSSDPFYIVSYYIKWVTTLLVKQYQLHFIIITLIIPGGILFWKIMLLYKKYTIIMLMQLFCDFGSTSLLLLQIRILTFRKWVTPKDAYLYESNTLRRSYNFWASALKTGSYSQSSTLYIYYIYIELACTQSPFFQNLPYESTASIPNQNKDIEFWLSAHIVRAYP